MKKINILYFSNQNYHKINLNILKLKYNLKILDDFGKINKIDISNYHVIFAPLGYYFDKNIIDKIVNGFGRSSLSVGRIFVRSFNGEIQFYSFVMILGLLACQIIIFVISYYVLGS